MVGLGYGEIIILLVVGLIIVAIPLGGIILGILTVRAASRDRAVAAPARHEYPAPPNATFSPPPSDSPAQLVARITQRFCPSCRSPLAADAPEGLCPACLMAGVIGGAERNATEGAAYSPDGVTTPPSGSKPPMTGEWTNLAQHFPQLEILELLGRGGMGSVYKARQKNLDRMVALKVIPPEAASDPAFAERFAREARALARLNHPNIVTVYDFGQTGDVYYLLMEYVDGVNLRQTLHAGKLQPHEALAIVPPICDALQYAHDQGVVHRDIKPENVLLDRSGRVKIADFGLAKLLGQSAENFTLTRTQQVMGTPRYMAPEQIEKPTTVDHRADIYSLGVMIYEMLTGELPIGRFDPPSHKVQVDVRIDQVVLRSLEKDPQRRYQQASHVKSELASAGNVAGATAPLPGAQGPYSPLVWQTPAPATKIDSAAAQPGGVPPGQVLIVAFGMLIGMLLMGGGFAALVWGLIYSIRSYADPAVLWSWWGAGFGCLVGGAGSTIGSYNTYRQMAGAEDLMRSPRTTWFDWVMRGYFVLGLLIMLPGAHGALFDADDEHVYPMLLLGGIAVFQSVLFLVWRMAIRPAGNSGPQGFADASGKSSSATLMSAVEGTGAMLQRFRRSATDQWLGGVCGGLGEATPLPAWCWRMLFLVLILGYGVGVFAYVLLWICVPEAESKAKPAPPRSFGPTIDALRNLTRSQTDAFLGGVCGGLGEHTLIPSWCWRILFVIATCGYGVGLVPYILLWICLPEGKAKPAAGTDQPDAPPTEASSRSKRYGTVALLAVVMMAFGLLFWGLSAANWNIFSGSASKSVMVRNEFDPERLVHPKQPVSDDDFAKLLTSLQSQSLDDGKVSFIKLISHTNAFTCDQVRQILRELSFDQGREQAAVILYPRVTDPKNFFTVFEVFTFDQARSSVNKRLKLDRPAKPLAVRPGEPVSDEEFSKLMASMKSSSMDEGKLAFVRVIAHGRSFRCDQASQLLKEFTFDADRVHAAVALHPRLSDPQNFYRVLEVFTFDTGRQAVLKRLKLD